MHNSMPNMNEGARRRRLVLLGGVSLLPLALSAICPRPAQAAACVSPVTIACTTLNVSSNGNLTVSNTGTITGSFGVDNSSYVVGTLVNEGGWIDGTDFGVYNDFGGTISVLDNQAGGRINAGISGPDDGVNNYGTLSRLTNEGTISGADGVRNYGDVYSYSPTVEAPGQMGTLTNSGTIQGSYAAILNEGGTITLVGNSGRLSGGTSGFQNQGEVSTLGNTGTIIGTNLGVDNLEGMIGTLNNSGTAALVSGGTDGVLNKATISTLSNAGTIIATLASGDGQNGAAVVGIKNDSGGTIDGLTNLATGTISGGSSGIYNLGSIGALSNGGLITGSSSGINNEGQIDTLTNTGTISGGSTAVDNEGGTIGLLSNTGTISGGSDDGILNTYNRGNSSLLGVIGSIDNTGSISSVDNQDLIGGAVAVAINNAGTIGLLNNDGTISGSETAVYDSGLIDTLTNSGTITSGLFAIQNYLGTIAVLDNKAGGLISGAYSGLYNYGSIIALSNEGTITGGSGIDTTNGGINTLTNEGLITGTNADGVLNAKDIIGTLANSGTISAAHYGIDNIGATTSGTLHAGVISTLSNTGTITGDNGAIDNQPYGTIDTLINAADATITSSDSAIDNRGMIGLLSNQGLIETGGDTAIYNEGTIMSLVNVGSIIAQSEDVIYNDGGTIFSLGNTGLISSTYQAIYNDGTIGLLTNSGTIKASQYGVYNDSGSGIGTIDNEAGGLIFGLDIGIETLGTIDLVKNGGTIRGQQGIIAAGNIGTIDNAGLISGSATAIDGYSSQVVGALINSGTITSADAAIYSRAFIGTLDNSGLINGGTTAVLYRGGLGTLTNSGTMRAGVQVIDVSSPTGTIDNSGLIAGGGTGIHANYTIALVSNSGTISGADNYGLYDDAGTITAIANSGVITGGTYGVFNRNETDEVFFPGAAGTLTNTGVISGGVAGIANQASIAAILNSGVISGGSLGVDDSTGTITAFSNAAVITGGSIAGVIMDSGTLQNSGTIAGPTGVILVGDNASIFDSGTIASTTGGDAILFEAVDPDSLTLTTGADIMGAIDGGTTAGTITLEGTGTLTADIVNFTAGSALDVVSGAHWAGAGNWTIAMLTNDGVFQGGLIGNALTLTGDFVQTPNGTLLVAVSPSGESQFVVDGAAVLAGGLKYSFAPGTYRAGTYKFLTVSGGITGGFADVAYDGKVPAAFTHATVQDASTGNLVLTAIPVVPGKKPASVVAPAESASCGAEAAGVRATGDGPGVSGQGRAAAAIGQAFCAAGGWVQATGGVATMDGGGGVTGFSTNMAGFLAGVDAPVGAGGTRVGLAVGYDEDWLKDGEGGKASVGTARFGVFGSQVLGQVVLASDFMLGTMSEDMTRQAGPRGATAKPGGTVYEGGVQAATAVPVDGFAVAPAVGLRAAVVDIGGFAERAPAPFGAFAVKGAASSYASVQPYAKVTVSRTYLTGGGVSVTPDVSVGYAAELADRGKAVGVTAADGTAFVSSKTTPDGNAAEFSAGVSAGQGGWSLYAKYAASVSGNWTAQSGEAGVAARF